MPASPGYHHATDIRDGDLRHAFDEATIGMAIVDLDGRYLKVNERLCRLLERDEATLLRSSVHEVTHPDDLDVTERMMREAMAGVRSGYELEKRFGGPEGRPIWALVHVSLIRDENATPLFFFAQIQDISMRKHAEAALAEVEARLRESEAAFRLLADNSTDMISRHTPEGDYVYVSPACARLLGYEPDELVGKSAFDFFHPKDLASIRQSHFSILTTEDPYTVEYRMRKKDGHYVWVEATSRAVRDPSPGPVTEIHASTHEITERMQAEIDRTAHAADLERANRELHAADEMKSRFVAITTHELKTPLTSILGFVSTLRSSAGQISEEDGAQALEVIERQAKRLARLVDDLLMVSRIDAEMVRADTWALDIRKTVEEAVDDFGEGGSAIRVDCPDGLSASADPHLLRQMLVNLIGNALKYGRPEYRVECTRNGEWVEIRVLDHGPGVPEEFRPRLFEAFQQAETGGAAAKKGSGLGLSIVRGLAQAQHGEAWYEPGTPGACFSIRLPVAE